MNGPHRGGGTARSAARGSGAAGRVGEPIAPRKSDGLEFSGSVGEGTSEIILGPGVLSRKPRTAVAEDGCDLWGRGATLEQFFGDPGIGDAPVRLWEAFPNLQSVQPIGIDVRGLSDGDRSSQVVCDRVARGGLRPRKAWRPRQVGVAAHTALGRLPQSSALRSQAGVGVQHLHPGSVAAPVAPLWFPIGETGQAAQVAPIGAGLVAPIGVSQLSADLRGDDGFEGCGADVHPSLEMAGAGLEHHTGLVSLALHGFDDGRGGLIEIDEDVTGVAPFGVKMEVDVAALAVANAQKPDDRRMGQLGSGPEPLSRKRLPGLVVKDPDEVEIVRHGRELSADGLHSEIESSVEHGPNFEIERTRRTMNSQRTANSGLTDCLSLGVHPTHRRLIKSHPQNSSAA